ncbi:MAG: hypothetical protein GY832_29620, partial [Chloroflexi bacterium]|nr:hypothetical protein [Chloroflexota bacterium]
MAFTGVTSLLQTMAVRSLTRTYRQQKTHEMEYRQYQVIARRKAEIEQLLADDGDWRQVLKQVIADAVPGVSPTWLTVMDVSATPVPHFDVTGEDGKRYTFTISPSFAFPWRARAIPLDASLSPAMRVEVQVIWEYLTEQQGIELP